MSETQAPRRRRWRIWIRRGFACWAVFVLLYLSNSMRTQGVAPSVLMSDETVTVTDSDERLEFRPRIDQSKCGLIFICGSGVAAEAYAPMLRPIADAGYSVVIVRLPWRFGPLESHKQQAIDRALATMRETADRRWVVAGHSLGGALTARIVRDHAADIAGAVLIGTTHPKSDDLSGSAVPVTKVFGTDDGIAPAHKVRANMHLLPANTRIVELAGANHSQFGHYGHQFRDHTPTMSREEQQQRTREAILEMLNRK